jgi:hypothetical protein
LYFNAIKNFTNLCEQIKSPVDFYKITNWVIYQVLSIFVKFVVWTCNAFQQACLITGVETQIRPPLKILHKHQNNICCVCTGFNLIYLKHLTSSYIMSVTCAKFD